jgi:hypothetical protein
MTSKTASTDKSKAAPEERALFEHEAGLKAALSKDDFRRVADVRRNIWTGSLIGLGIGLVSATVGIHVGFSHLMKRPTWWKGQHTGATILGFGALFSFLGALKRGGPEVASISDVFDRYRMPDETKFPYEHRQQKERLMKEAKEIEIRDALISKLGERR